ncbi:MAG: hypothetical protein ACTSYA_00880 [Candidatus Kariarchaeaceae archaeon]
MSSSTDLWEQYNKFFVSAFLSSKEISFDWPSPNICRLLGSRDYYHINVLTATIYLEQRKTDLKWFWLEAPKWVVIPTPSLDLPPGFPANYHSEPLKLTGIPAKVFAVLTELADDKSIDNIYIATQLMPTSDSLHVPTPSKAPTPSQPPPSDMHPLSTDYEVAPHITLSNSLSRGEIVQLLEAFLMIIALSSDEDEHNVETTKNLFTYSERLIASMKKRSSGDALREDELATLRTLLDFLSSLS